ncbi:MAG: NmrA family NAD(P)-binding protein [Deltaproteobacteria bacterium]|nr:NmrA family NAD(P)-binding protein [Deltaproteobacteria bacterium]
MYVIAGVTGHVGSFVASELLGRKQKIKVIVRDAAKGARWAQQGAEVAVGSLEDAAFLTGVLRGAQGFFTLLPPDFAPPDFFGAQCRKADAIAAAVKSAGTPHVVILSSVGADLPAGTGPIKGLHYLENVLRATGTKLTAIRAGFFQENVGETLRAARTGGIVPTFAPADAAMPMIATRDIGTVAAQALLAGPKDEIVDVHGPAYSMRQVAEKLGAALGKTLPLVEIPRENWVGALTQAGLPRHAAEVFAEMYAAFGTGNIRPCGDRMVQGKTTLDETLKTLLG